MGSVCSTRTRTAESRRLMTYAEPYQRSLDDPESFWISAADTVTWERRPDRALDDSRAPFYRWFPGGRMNTAYNALDRHVEAGRGEQVALIHHSAYTGVSRLT